LLADDLELGRLFRGVVVGDFRQDAGFRSVLAASDPVAGSRRPPLAQPGQAAQGQDQQQREQDDGRQHPQNGRG
jgi:hypothetical protein